MAESTNNSHIKPTPQELEEENKRLLAEAEALTAQAAVEGEDEEEEVVPEEPVVLPPLEDKEVVEEKAETEETPPVEESKEETPDKEVVEEDKPLHDWEKRYKDSSSEAQRLYKNNAVMNKAIAEANDLPEPTEEELKGEYGDDWNLYDNQEKRIYKEMFVSKRFRSHINEASKEIRDIEAWNEKVIKFIEDPQVLLDFPELDSKAKSEQFKIYAADRSVQGSNMSVLVNSFLHEISKSEKPKSKGAMFETGKGGPNDKPKPTSTKLSVSDSARLAQTNYKLYVEYLRAGKISTEIE